MKVIKNVHAEELSAFIRPEHIHRVQIPSHIRFIFLCYTNRSGSNYVAETLASGGKFNLAGEFFNYDTVKSHSARRGFTDLGEYLSFLCRHAAKSGTLICKAAATHLALLTRAGILDRILSRSQFVLVERNDRLSQAISMSIASQTGQWTTAMQARKSPETLVYDVGQIESIIKNIVAQQAALHVFLAVNGLGCFTVTYEQITANPELYTRALCDWLEIEPGDVHPGNVRISKQSSGLNLRWRQLYLGSDDVEMVEAAHAL